jgi:hypothetical protein
MNRFKNILYILCFLDVSNKNQVICEIKRDNNTLNIKSVHLLIFTSLCVIIYIMFYCCFEYFIHKHNKKYIY